MTEEEKIAELLKPRYIVMADWPESPLCEGDIIKGESSYWGAKEKEYFHADFPKIFKPLAWYEYRKVEEMPEYVKSATGIVYKVAHPSQNGRIWHTEGEIEHRFINSTFYLPATSTDFNNNINQK